MEWSICIRSFDREAKEKRVTGSSVLFSSSSFPARTRLSASGWSSRNRYTVV